MRRPPIWSLLLLLPACEARISDAPGDLVLTDAATQDDGAIDAPVDAVVLGPWSAPAKIPQASTTAIEDDNTLSSNALELIFAIDDPNGKNGKDLYYSARASLTAPWSTPTKLLFSSGTQSDETPRFSADDKTLYFASGRAGNGNLDVYSVTRAAAGSTTWGMPAAVTSVNTTTLTEKWFMPCGTNHYIMVQSTTNNGTDLVEGTLGGGAPTPIDTLNSAQSETGTFVSQDCLTIYFASTRPTATSPSKIYKSHRDTLTSPWQPPSVVDSFPISGGNGSQEDPWMSTDGRTFVFTSDAAGTKDVYISTR
jgi:WD40-like Beta Propeller Repeat